MVIEENPLVFSPTMRPVVFTKLSPCTRRSTCSPASTPQTIIITSVFQAESRATGNGSQTRLRGDEREEGKVGKT